MARLLSFDDLELAWQRLSAEARRRFGGEIELDVLPVSVGQYRSVDVRDAYTMATDPATGIGDVTDDLESVSEPLDVDDRGKSISGTTWTSSLGCCGYWRSLTCPSAAARSRVAGAEGLARERWL